MPDVYAAIAEVDVATQERLAVILELRAADPQQRAMLDSYLSEVGFAPAARVLEVGWGTGAVTRVLARRPEVAEAVGVDPSPVFVAKAGELAAFRVLRPGGTLAVCDGDYATTTVAVAEGDPLQDCIEAVKAGVPQRPLARASAAGAAAVGRVPATWFAQPWLPANPPA